MTEEKYYGSYINSEEVDSLYHLADHKLPKYNVKGLADSVTFYASSDIAKVIGNEKMRQLQCDITTNFIPCTERFVIPQDIDEYYNTVVEGILSHFTDAEKRMAGVDKEYILDMVTEHKNEYGEYDLKYSQFEKSLTDYYENNETIDNAINGLLDGCKTLIYGHLSVL